MIEIVYPDFANDTVLVVGDVMRGRYFRGDVARISPAAPVSVVRINKNTLTLNVPKGGGAH
jgi:D-beta-D-heptose 7-phosphate kinase/D-beta-D-heptose 1-phosphate adenosyltransferase